MYASLPNRAWRWNILLSFCISSFAPVRFFCRSRSAMSIAISDSQFFFFAFGTCCSAALRIASFISHHNWFDSLSNRFRDSNLFLTSTLCFFMSLMCHIWLAVCSSLLSLTSVWALQLVTHGLCHSLPLVEFLLRALSLPICHSSLCNKFHFGTSHLELSICKASVWAAWTKCWQFLVDYLHRNWPPFTGFISGSKSVLPCCLWPSSLSDWHLDHPSPLWYLPMVY